MPSEEASQYRLAAISQASDWGGFDLSQNLAMTIELMNHVRCLTSLILFARKAGDIFKSI
jgi:hypothetical protein